MKAGVRLSNLRIIPEEMIIKCSDKFKQDEPNNFKLMLETGHEFRMAGLTPVYLCSISFRNVYVTSQENLDKEYH